MNAPPPSAVRDAPDRNPVGRVAETRDTADGRDASLGTTADPLSKAQQAAVRHGLGDADALGAAPAALLIIAGAGSGKTRTLASRVAHLIASGCDPQRILLMSFSRRAAAELERRTGQILCEVLALGAATEPPALPWSGTFHSVGARLLRQYANRIGLNDAFTVHDRSDASDLMGLARHELCLSALKRRFPTKDTCLAIYSRTVNSQSPLEDVLETAFPWCAQWHAELRDLFGRYVREKHAQNILDYDDLLLYWAEMVAVPVLAKEIGARFDHILVDEYQDTNRLQATILTALKPDGRGLTVVGDDAQAIYSFRAASVRNILDFPKLFVPAARLVTLERNYRSSGPILAASNAVIGLARERFAKNLWTARVGGRLPRLVTVTDEAEQAHYVASEVLEARESGVALRAQAVLFRSASHSAPLELELARRNIPFVKYGGLKFLEAAHVKDLLSVLRWSENPRCRVAGLRVLQLVPGIGPATAGRVLDAVARASDPASAFEALTVRAAGNGSDWAALVKTFAALRSSDAHWPADFERARQWLDAQLERLYDDARARRQDLEQLGRIAAAYATRERFLTELTLDPPQASSGAAGVPARDEDYLILSTIHSAKGQEWKAVYVLNLVDGCIPSDMASGSTEELEEERRLLYVAMTRAKEHLQLISPQRFYVSQQSAYGDRHVYALRSRFVPEGLVALFETVTWPGPPVGESPTGVPDGALGNAPGVIRDIGADLASRWSTPEVRRR